MESTQDDAAVRDYGSTPLHRAACTGYRLGAARMLKACNYGTARNKDELLDSHNALHLAVFKGYEAIVDLLLRFGANKNAVTRGELADCDTPLHFAAEKGYAAIVTLLFKTRAYTEAQNEWGWKPLHLAARYGHGAIVELFLQADVDKHAKTAHGETPLHVAAGYGTQEVVEILLKANVDPTIQNKRMQTQLHLAAQRDPSLIEPTITLFLEGATYKEQEDVSGNTPLSRTLDRTSRTIGHYVLPRITRMFLLAGDGELTPAPKSLRRLQRAGFNCDIFKKTLTKSKKFLKKHCDALSSFLQKEGIPTALAKLIVEYHNDLAIRILSFIHVELLNEGLLKAAQEGNSEDVASWLHAGADATVQDKGDLTPVHWAGLRGYGAIAELLIKEGADKNARSIEGATPLHMATKCGHESVVDILLNAGADKTIQDRNGCTPLHIAARQDHSTIEPIVALLLEGSAYREQADASGNTPLSYALSKIIDTIDHSTLPRIATMLLLACNGELTPTPSTEGLLYQWRFNQDIFKRTITASKEFLKKQIPALCLFTLDNNRLPMDLMKLILEYYASLDILTLFFTHVEYLHTSLFEAALLGDSKEVERLLLNGVNQDMVNKDGLRPLHLAAEHGHEEIVKLLLEHGADKNAVEKSSWTPLHLAAEHGNKEVVEMLLKAGANIAAEDKIGQTPLHMAAFNGHGAVVEILLRANADKNAASKDGWTPLHIAALKGHGAIIELLIKASAYINWVTTGGSFIGYTPLHLAAQAGHQAVVEILLKYGAYKTMRNQAGETALEVAANNVIDLLIGSK